MTCLLCVSRLVLCELVAMFRKCEEARFVGGRSSGLMHRNSKNAMSEDVVDTCAPCLFSSNVGNQDVIQ